MHVKIKFRIAWRCLTEMRSLKLHISRSSQDSSTFLKVWFIAYTDFLFCIGITKYYKDMLLLVDEINEGVFIHYTVEVSEFA